MLNKQVALPWGLFLMTAIYAMMPSGTIDAKCTPVNETIQHPVHVPVGLHVPVGVHSIVVHDDGAVHNEHAVHHVRHVQEESRQDQDVRDVQASLHQVNSIQDSDERSTLFVMSVTLMTYLFIKVVVVPPRGYKKYI